ncbi:MAG: haloacid dehalogenase type II [Alphaproteobacteria bacterium]|nr:haloacid dehalogenase type II [Alphaproteobacteria bacterium]MBU0799021.1 haloacid dehalogenase type II [Alphaproteobacteria bacterium]MBU0889251.1 haloacid dehalogenase type II [Alphaproteobacteria bacterium]MBU1815067.1 haloacid dehalogenase type II [Alphaproteobacteria bacterium]MBU2089949.1 haloacid dehalogenase type II [Alphaproteobacteria bacterium]
MIRAIAFDAYGTLFDVHSVRALLEEIYPGRAGAISILWRQKQLEYTWLRALMERYEDFWAITRSGLIYALKNQGIKPRPADVERLMAQYLKLDPHVEAIEALTALKQSGLRLAISSNGSPAMLDAVVRHAGLDTLLEAVISVDPVRVFKPHHKAYDIVTETLALPAADILFVSSNGFDVAGATYYGFETAWIQRSAGQAEELGATPAHSIRYLTDLVTLVS